MEETKDAHTRIIEAFSLDGCPLCAILWRNELDSLYQWVGESNENAKSSGRIRHFLDAGGFCNYHFWRFEQMCTHYAIANIGAQLIEKLVEILRTNKLKRPINSLKRKEKISDAWFTECPLCFELKEKEKNTLENY